MTRWLNALLGLALVALGLTLLLHFSASLEALVVLVVVVMALLGLSRHGLVRLAWLLGAIAVALAPGLGLRTLAFVLGVMLVLEGGHDVVTAIRGRWQEQPTPTVDGRVARALLGAASALLGVLALVWPGLTLTVLALLIGARVAWGGLELLFAAIRGSRGADPEARPGPWTRSWLVLRAVAALGVVLALVAVSTVLVRGRPTPDAFYDPPARVPDEPGQLLLTQPFTRDVPAGSRGWRILYTTTRDEGRPALASAIVVSPGASAADPQPVLAWAHGTTGIAEGCAPSILDHPFEAGAMPALDLALERGWAVVATDYVGLGTAGPHPYLVGQAEGRSVLDAVRAARQLDDLVLAERTVVWGHSQGGHAALWTGQLAAEYAPDAHVEAVAALAPASDVAGLVDSVGKVNIGSIFASYVIEAYAEVYDDVASDDYVRATARLQVAEMAARCLAEPSIAVSAVEALLFDRPVWSREPDGGPLGARLAENVPDGPRGIPVLLAQGADDDLVTPAVQGDYVEARCADGMEVDYRVYPGRDHLGLVAEDSELIPDLLAWTEDRFAGQPAVGGEGPC